jgi:hypothetical protein
MPAKNERPIYGYARVAELRRKLEGYGKTPITEAMLLNVIRNPGPDPGRDSARHERERRGDGRGWNRGRRGRNRGGRGGNCGRLGGRCGRLDESCGKRIGSTDRRSKACGRRSGSSGRRSRNCGGHGVGDADSADRLRHPAPHGERDAARVVRGAGVAAPRRDGERGPTQHCRSAPRGIPVYGRIPGSPGLQWGNPGIRLDLGGKPAANPPGRQRGLRARGRPDRACREGGEVERACREAARIRHAAQAPRTQDQTAGVVNGRRPSPGRSRRGAPLLADDRKPACGDRIRRHSSPSTGGAGPSGAALILNLYR